MRFKIYLTLNGHRIDWVETSIDKYVRYFIFYMGREGFQRPGGIPWEGFSSGLQTCAA